MPSSSKKPSTFIVTVSPLEMMEAAYPGSFHLIFLSRPADQAVMNFNITMSEDVEAVLIHI